MRRGIVVTLVVFLVVLVAAAVVFIRRSLAPEQVRATLERQLALRLGQPVRIGSAGITIFPRASIDLSDVSIGAPPAIQVATIHVGAGWRGLLSRTIDDAEVVAADGRLTLPLPFPLVPVEPGSEEIGSGAPIRVESVGVISLRDFALVAGEESLQISLESSLHGDRLEVTELTASSEHTKLGASGRVESLSKLQAQFDATADSLDLDELIAIGSAFTASPGASAAAPLHITGKLTAREGQFASYPFRDLSSAVEATTARLVLSPLAVRAFGGNFNGRLEVESQHAQPLLHLTGQLAGYDVAGLLEASGAAGGITGTLGGRVNITGQGRDTDTLMRTSRGSLSAAVTDGAMPGLEMVRAIVLAFGKPSGAPPKGSGSAFSRLGGNFALENGVLTSKDITMAARDFDLAGTGSLRLATGAAEARVNVVLSRELTAQAGTDLRRYAQEDGRVILPATISGTLQRPAISIDLASATRRAVENELRRRARELLEGLFKKKD